MFSSMFSENRKENRQKNIILKVEIDIRLLIKESNILVNYDRKTICNKCNGLKAESEKDIENCKKCNGKGILLINKRFGISVQVVCQNCKGIGKIITKKCKNCNGYGFISKKEKTNVQIPQGCPDGFRVLLRGLGNEYEKERYGDLIINVYTKDDPFYHRINDNDVLIQMPIPLHKAIIGGKIEIPTLYGIKEINIPQGIQEEQRIICSGVGLPDYNNNYIKGDQYIICRIETPKYISEKLKEILNNIPINEETYPYYVKSIKK